MDPILVRRYGEQRGTPVVVIHGGPAAPGSAAGLARGLGSDFFVLEPFQRSSGTVPLTVAQHAFFGAGPRLLHQQSASFFAAL